LIPANPGPPEKWPLKQIISFGYFVQELKESATDTRHRVDELVGLSQSMLSVVKDSPTKSSIRQKLHRLQSSLQHIDSELGVFTVFGLCV